MALEIVGSHDCRRPDPGDVDDAMPFARLIVDLGTALDKMRRCAGSMNEIDSWIGNECGYAEDAARADAALASLRSLGIDTEEPK